MEKSQYEVMYQVEENHFWYQGMRNISESLLQKYLDKKNKLNILDVGCGTGGSIVFLKKYGNVYGVDISEQALKYCKKRGLKKIQIGSINKLPFSDNFFDLVTCFDVIYHKKVNDKKAILELYRILKPGGILILRSAAYNWLYSQHDIPIETRYRYVKREINELLNQAGFINLKITYINSLLFPFIALKRIGERILGFSNSQVSDVKPVNPFLNKLLVVPLLIEKYLIKYLNLPFGLSIVAVSKKAE